MLGSPLISLLFWILICFSIAALFTKRYSIRPLIVALILRSIYYLGIGPTLNILGANLRTWSYLKIALALEVKLNS